MAKLFSATVSINEMVMSLKRASGILEQFSWVLAAMQGSEYKV